MGTSRINFILKRPVKGSRKSFSILKRTITDKKTSYEKVESEAITAINNSLVSKLQDLTTCEQLAKEVVASLYKEEEKKHPKAVHNSENRVLLEKYWKAEYEHRELVDYESSKNELKRAIDAAGALSLYSVTREELQKEVAKTVSGNAQRRVATCLNQFLKYIGRDFKLRKDKRTIAEVRFLSQTEFKKMIKFIDDEEMRVLHEVAFGTGGRVGELLALKANSIKGNFIDILTQIDRAEERRGTKSRRIRKAFVLPDWRGSVEQWCGKKNSIDRATKFAEVTRRACMKAFPDNKDKWCTFKDLRHSYAVHLLSKGVSLSLVAQSLGNSIVVCEMHYAGFTLSNDSMEAIEAIVKR